MADSGLQENPGAFASGPRHAYFEEFKRRKVLKVDPKNGAQDLIYDPTDPQQIAPYGCLIESADRTPGRRALVAAAWEAPEIMQGLPLAALPDNFLLGPKELGGGLGKEVVGTCLQRIGDCVAACGSNVVEGTMNSEQVIYGVNQLHPEISICYLYYGAQTFYGNAPGGDGAYTQGLAGTLQGYNQTKWANVGGRYGGVVHEKAFEGETDPELKDGWPYEPIKVGRAGVAPPKKFIELALKHLCGDGQGDCRAVTTFQAYLEMVASGHIGFTGIRWPQSWSYVDKNGFVTKNLSGGGGGHEVNFCGYLKRKAQSGFGGSNTHTRQLADGEDYWVEMGNSWGLDFGLRGHILVPYSQFMQVNALKEMYTISYVNGWDKSRLLNWLRVVS